MNTKDKFNFLEHVVSSSLRKQARGSVMWFLLFWKSWIFEKYWIYVWKSFKTKKAFFEMTYWGENRFMYGMFLKGYRLDWENYPNKNMWELD